MAAFTAVKPQIFTITGFLTAEECHAYIALSEAKGFGQASITTAFGPQSDGFGMRTNMRVMIDDPQRAVDLWRRVACFIPNLFEGWTAVGLNERLRFYRYERGHVLRWHQDGSFERLNGEQSKLTFMIYLNDGFKGGTTLFSNTEIVPAKGMALLFVHELGHEGCVVTDGRKYVLRSDVMYRATAAHSAG